jgi:Domain of unknown function (DUF4440)
MTSQVKNETADELIREREKAETIAILKEDYTKLNEIWHPEFRVNTPLNRILGAEEIQDAMKAGFIRYSFLERNIEEIKIHENLVITLGNEVTIPIENAPGSGQKITRRFTNIWILENEKWRMFSRHASNICG